MKNEVVKEEKHYTASVWLMTKGEPRKTLLLHHKKFDSWVQPGGHIDVFENPVEAAIREVKEETGIDIGFLRDEIKVADSTANFLPVPTFLLEERILAHGDQPEHFHIDLMYVVEVEEQRLFSNQNESHEIGWYTLDEALRLSLYENTKKIIQKLL